MQNTETHSGLCEFWVFSVHVRDCSSDSSGSPMRFLSRAKKEFSKYSIIYVSYISVSCELYKLRHTLTTIKVRQPTGESRDQTLLLSSVRSQHVLQLI